ncbi:MAG: peptide transporter permease [Geminicoccaceae bacterium]|nr:peptide transporter permease [Geminicoccaceae bacterium]
MDAAADRRTRRADLGLRLGIIALGVVLVLVFAAPMLLPFDAETMSADAILSPPDVRHWLGTDHLGRDVFARTVLGGRSTLALAVAATALGVGIGASVGMVAGYKAGLIDNLLMRTSDAVMALPSLILAMLVMVAVGSGPVAILLAIVLIFAPRAARITRSVVLNVARLDFVAAASVVGESQTSVLVREILPNVWHPGRGMPALLLRDSADQRAGLSRDRHPAADARLGTDDLRGCGLHHGGPLDDLRSGARHRSRCDQRQHCWRRAARAHRSAAPQDDRACLTRFSRSETCGSNTGRA